MNDMNKIIITHTVDEFKELSSNIPNNTDENAWLNFFTKNKTTIERVNTFLTVICEAIGACDFIKSYELGDITFTYNKVNYLRDETVPIDELENYVLNHNN